MNAVPDNAEVAGRFGAVAKRFCAIVDSAPGLNRTDLLMQIYRILPQLIGEAISLPNLESSDGDDEDEESEEELVGKFKESVLRAEADSLSYVASEWRPLYVSLQKKLGDWDLYREVFDPTKDTETVCGSLADDIADIYHDLKEGIDLSEASPEEGIWHWRVQFSHWGHHAIDALRTMHVLLEDTFTFPSS